MPRAWELVHGGGLDPGWYDYPSLLFLVLAPSQVLADAPSYGAARVVAVVIGVAGVAAAWWLGRAAYGRLAGSWRSRDRRRDDPRRLLAHGRHGRAPDARDHRDARAPRHRSPRVGRRRRRARRVGEVPRRCARRAARGRRLPRVASSGTRGRPRGDRIRGHEPLRPHPRRGCMGRHRAGAAAREGTAGSASRTILRRRSRSPSGSGTRSARSRSSASRPCARRLEADAPGPRAALVRRGLCALAAAGRGALRPLCAPAGPGAVRPRRARPVARDRQPS